MVLRIVYSIMMLVAAWLLVRRNSDAKQPQHESCPQGESRELTDVEGETYRFCAHGLKLQRTVSGGGAFLTGLISTGIGEVTVPGLIVRSGFPVPIAAATSLVLVAVADISAVLTHFVQFLMSEGLTAISWNLIVWGVPGMAAGAFVGTHLQGRISERASQRFFAGLFVLISLTFLAFTIFGE